MSQCESAADNEYVYEDAEHESEEEMVDKTLAETPQGRHTRSRTQSKPLMIPEPFRLTDNSDNYQDHRGLFIKLPHYSQIQVSTNVVVQRIQAIFSKNLTQKKVMGRWCSGSTRFKCMNLKS